MVIYAEYLFCENFLTGLLILHLTGRILSLKPKRWRLVTGGALCGLYSFVLFLPGLPLLLGVGMKIAFSGSLMFFVFRVVKRQLLRTALIFYMVSFACGGVTIGLMYFAGLQGISANNTLYLDGLSYLNITAGFFAAYLGICLFHRWLKERRLAEQMEALVTITLGEQAITVPALLDTGNFLRDPATKKPVIILEAAAFLLLLPAEVKALIQIEEKVETLYGTLAETSVKNRLRLIPFQSVGQSQGMLLGIRPDTTTVTMNDGHCRSVEVILGIYPGSLGENWDQQRCKALLSPAITEGGIATNAQKTS